MNATANTLIVAMAVVLLASCAGQHRGGVGQTMPSRATVPLGSEQVPAGAEGIAYPSGPSQSSDDTRPTEPVRHGLDVYVAGVYSASFETKDADGRVQRREGRAIISRVLGGQFVQIDIEAGNPLTFAKTLVQYDAEKRTCRAWFFTDSGYVTQGESRRSEKNPRTSVSEGVLNNLRYKGTTEHSEDYTSVVDTYHWYDEAGRLLRTDIGRFRLLTPQQDDPVGGGHRTDVERDSASSGNGSGR